jgi:RNA ligase
VVNYYGRCDLIFLSAFDNETGTEFLPHAIDVPMTKAHELFTERYFPAIRGELTKLSRPNTEGIVVRFQNGFRVKMKLAEYVRLHISGCSNRSIWEALKKGDLDQTLAALPDEMHVWARKVAKKLHKEFDIVKQRAYNEYMERPDKAVACRKTYAEYVKMCSSPSPLLFHLYDGKDIDSMVWEKVRPERAVLYGYETPVLAAVK